MSAHQATAPTQADAAAASAPIGVFDSGIGGLSILRALRAQLPHEDFVYFADTGHAPYGERAEAFVAERSMAVSRELIERRAVKLMVVACNTATAAAVATLRAAWPGLPIVGVEPALKPAALATRTGRVGVLATRGTLESSKFRQLHASLEAQARFVLQPCDGLAAAIEARDEARIDTLCARYVGALGELGTRPGQIDTLVLGCTHYALVMPQFVRLAGPQVRLLETGEPVARQCRRLLSESSLLHPGITPGLVTLIGSGDPVALAEAAEHWLAD